MSLPTRDDMEAAVGRIALSPDGRLLYRLLQIELMSRAPDGALPQHEGRRSLAHDIKVLMDRELSKVDRPRDRSDTHDPDAPAVTEPAVTVSGTGSRGARRRVEPYAEPVPKPKPA